MIEGELKEIINANDLINIIMKYVDCKAEIPFMKKIQIKNMGIYFFDGLPEKVKSDSG